MSATHRFLVVANPVARKGAERIVEMLRAEAPPNVELDVHFTTPDHFASGDLREQASRCEAAIAVGGDGTVADTTTAIDGVDIPIGIIPAGSTNVIARNFRIPADPKAAAHLAFTRPATKRIDVGLCNGRRFIHMGGAGFDSRMFAATDRRLKKKLGWLAYLQGASKSITAPPARFVIDVDGVELECPSPLVLVANGDFVVTPAMKVGQGIRYDDGVLDVVLVTATHPSEIARTIGRFAARSLEKSPYTVHLRGRQIELRSDPPLPLQLDGDIVGTTPARFSILPLALDLIVPR